MKPFSQELYDNDDDAKLQMLAWLWKWQPKLNWRVNPDQYGVDLVSDSDWTIEVEVRHGWIGDAFPFPNVHISTRKAKFATPNAYFAIMNHDRTHALIVGSDSFAAAPTVFKGTKYTFNEPFVEIPLHECLTINVTPGTDTINKLGNERTPIDDEGPII